MRRDHYVLAILFFINISIAIFSFGNFVVEDAAIHSEISSLIVQNGPLTGNYMPVSDTLLTYPPLFHYFAALLSLFMPVLTATRFLGAVLFAFLPVSVYFASKLLTKKPIIPAIFSVIVINLAYILVYSAFPQILAFNLFLFFLYFFVRKRYVVAGLFSGLTILSHPFMGLFTLFFLLIILGLYKKEALKTILVSLAVSSVWMARYFMIIANAISNTWNNSRWIEIQGNNFESLAVVYNLLFYRINIVIFIMSLAGLYMFLKSRENGLNLKVMLSFLFIFPLIFTVYHFSPSQYKFFDLLTLPVLIFSGVLFSKDMNLGRNAKALMLIAGTLFFIVSMALVVKNIHDFKLDSQKSLSVFDDRYYPAADWLRENRNDFSRIVLLDNSSIEKNSRNFTSELVFSQISGKYPMDGTISDLEDYTENYKMQLSDRKRIIEGYYSLLKKYNVRYLIGKECIGKVIYSDGFAKICEV